jgi:DNA-binding Lrp family transcriptional regulator
MDRIDRRILARYQSDTRRTAASIGAEIGLSAAAVQRRLKRLRADGARAVGVHIRCIVLLTMASRPGPSKHLARSKRDMARLPEIGQCYQVTGASDMVLVVAARSMEGYRAFAEQWFERHEDVVRYETLVVLDAVKEELSLPIATA